jgi:metal-sulfur cluster biosynthetic enzyme
VDVSQRSLERSPATRLDSVTPEQVRAALNTVIDPCSVVVGAPGGLDDMGLVRAVDVGETPDGAAVDVTIGVTEPTCLMGVVFLRDAEVAVRALPGVAAVTVRLDHTLRYDVSMQRPEYAARLRAAREQRNVTIGVTIGVTIDVTSGTAS